MVGFGSLKVKTSQRRKPRFCRVLLPALFLLASAASGQIALPGGPAPVPSDLRDAAVLAGRPVFLTSNPALLARLDPQTGAIELFDLGASAHTIGEAAGGLMLLASGPSGTRLFDANLSLILSAGPAGDDVGGIPGTSRGFILSRSGQYVEFFELGAPGTIAHVDFDDEPTGCAPAPESLVVALAGGTLVHLDADGNELGRLDVSQSLTGVAVAGDVALALDRALGTLTAVDLDDLDPIGALGGLDDPESVHAVGATAFVIESDGRVETVDADPLSPRFMMRRAEFRADGAVTVVGAGGAYYVTRADRTGVATGTFAALAAAPILDAVGPTVGVPGTRLTGGTPGTTWALFAGGAMSLHATEPLRVPLSTAPAQTVRVGRTGDGGATTSATHPFWVADTVPALTMLADEMRDADYKQAAKRLDQARKHLVAGRHHLFAFKLKQAVDHAGPFARRVVEIAQYEAWKDLTAETQADFESGEAALEADNYEAAADSFLECMCDP